MYNNRIDFCIYLPKFLLENKSGNKFDTDGLIKTSPLSPPIIKRIGKLNLISYSAIACLQEPQGGTGTLMVWFFEMAEMAIAIIFLLGC
jgi:hypothetical protein